MVHDSLIEIFSSEMGVSWGGHHLKDSIVNGEDWDIEGSSSKIEDQNVLFTGFFVKTIGNGGSSGFIQDSDDVKTGDGSGVFGGLSLGIVEIGWDGDHSVDDSVSDVGFSYLFHSS